jgi:nucleoside phosphorylase
MGKVFAANVAANLRSSFHRVRLCLVVGICGGVPSYKRPDTDHAIEEILLGDVIISTGIVQYDFARQFPDKVVRKDNPDDNLSRPPPEIRSFLPMIRGLHGRQRLRENTRFYLTEICNTRGFEKLKYPGANEDKLYESAHVCAEYENEELEPSCKCDDKRLVPRSRFGNREAEGPQIHFGRFASGDLVMKSGRHRDQIAEKENVIAFEMEGAGVWENFPSMLVKAVCDYADNRKNKEWQGYAAAAAAACTKAVLKEWTATNRQQEFEPQRSMKNILFSRFKKGWKSLTISSKENMRRGAPRDLPSRLLPISRANTVPAVINNNYDNNNLGLSERRSSDQTSPSASRTTTFSEVSKTAPSTSPLLQACEERKLDTIKDLLQKHSVTEKDSKNRGVLHLALGSGRVNTNESRMHLISNVVLLLCEHGADVNAADHSGNCPIHYCAMTMNLEAAKYLLQEHNAQINALNSEKHTALYYVAIDAHPDVRFAKMLIEGGGNLGRTKKLQPWPSNASKSQQAVRDMILAKGVRPVS